MSVATSHRKEPTEMNVISKAKDVFKHSRLMIKNDSRFPKKERFMLSKDIYEYSRKLKKFRKLLDKEQITMECIHQSYQSWKGHALRGNCHHLVRDMDELYNQLFKEVKENVSTVIEPANRGKS